MKRCHTKKLAPWIKNWKQPEAVIQITDTRLYCVCKTVDDGSFMSKCEECRDLFHGRCVNVTQADLDEDPGTAFVCPRCLDSCTWKIEVKNSCKKLKTVLSCCRNLVSKRSFS